MATSILGLKNDYDDGGAADDTWFNGVSDNLESCFASRLSIDVGGGSNVTLTDAQASNSILQLTGALTASISVILPAWPKQWLVVNATSGSFSVTVKTASGSGISITQGYGAVLYGDGTDILRETVDQAAGTLRITSPRIITSVLDTNGNEVFKITATASAVNELTFTNAATGSGPLIEATGDDTNIDVTLRGKGTGGVTVSRSGGKLAFFGATLQSRATALTQTYATADRTLSAYTSDPENVAYTGAADGEAKLADLNALRVAYENLRAFTEDLAQFVNAVVDDLQAYGLEQ